MNLQSRKTIEKTRFQNKIFLKFLLFTTYNLQLRKVIRIKKSFFGLRPLLKLENYDENEV
tara:strand:+ start:1493 stop:1672 length:180 start_codon:yes stop_codon:yes gene_type:complete